MDDSISSHSSTHDQGKPMLLLEVIESKADKTTPYKLRLIPETVEYLLGAQPDRFIAPVTICGPYRSGKSFLLNQLLSRTNEGFNVGSTTQACTKGVWLWSSPLELDLNVGKDTDLPTDLFFLDCEGLGSLERDSSLDNLLLTISLFTSTILIYNTVGALEERRIEELAALTALVDRISRKNEEVGMDIRKDLPQLFWILRDFTLDLEADTPQDYLEKCLSELPPDNIQNERGLAELKQKNKVRKAIRTYFPKRTCHTFQRPVLGSEQALQKIESDEAIRPEFKKDVQYLLKSILQATLPKTSSGTFLTTKLYFSLLEEVVNCLNSGETPMPGESIERLLAAEAQEKTRRIVGRVVQALDSVKEQFPISDLTLCLKYTDILLRHLDILREEISQIASKEIYSNYVKLFVTGCQEKFHELVQVNKGLRTGKTSQAIKDFEMVLPTTLEKSSALTDALGPVQALHAAFFTPEQDGSLDWARVADYTVNSLLTELARVDHRSGEAFVTKQEELKSEIALLQEKERVQNERIAQLDEFLAQVRKEKERSKEFQNTLENTHRDREIDALKTEIKLMKDKNDRLNEKFQAEKANESQLKQRIAQLEGKAVEAGEKVLANESEMLKIVDQLKNMRTEVQPGGSQTSEEITSELLGLVQKLVLGVEKLTTEVRISSNRKISVLEERLALREREIQELEEQRANAYRAIRDQYTRKLQESAAANTKILESLQQARTSQMEQMRSYQAQLQDKRTLESEVKRLKEREVQWLAREQEMIRERDLSKQNGQLSEASLIDMTQSLEKIMQDKALEQAELVDIIATVVMYGKGQLKGNEKQLIGLIQNKFTQDKIAKLKPFFEANKLKI